MKFITVSGETITGIFDKINAPKDSYQISAEDYNRIRQAEYGMGHFKWVDGKLVKKEIASTKHKKANRQVDVYQELHDLQTTLKCLIELLHLSNTINVDDLPIRSRLKFDLPSEQNQSLTSKGLMDPNFKGLGDDQL